MIGKVQLNNKPSFGAKFYNYPHCLTNPEIKEKFQKATKEYPDYVLSQENISFFDINLLPFYFALNYLKTFWQIYIFEQLIC